MNSFVFDTNALISAMLSPFSTNATALKLAERKGEAVYSDATFSEFSQVFCRKKFDRYFS
jgi:uncharacterized protein